MRCNKIWIALLISVAILVFLFKEHTNIEENTNSPTGAAVISRPTNLIPNNFIKRQAPILTIVVASPTTTQTPRDRTGDSSCLSSAEIDRLVSDLQLTELDRMLAETKTHVEVLIVHSNRDGCVAHTAAERDRLTAVSLRSVSPLSDSAFSSFDDAFLFGATHAYSQLLLLLPYGTKFAASQERDSTQSYWRVIIDSLIPQFQQQKDLVIVGSTLLESGGALVLSNGLDVSRTKVKDLTAFHQQAGYSTAYIMSAAMSEPLHSRLCVSLLGAFVRRQTLRDIQQQQQQQQQQQPPQTEEKASNDELLREKLLDVSLDFDICLRASATQSPAVRITPLVIFELPIRLSQVPLGLPSSAESASEPIPRFSWWKITEEEQRQLDEKRRREEIMEARNKRRDERWSAVTSPYENFLTEYLSAFEKTQPATKVAWDFGAGGCTGWFIETVNYVTTIERLIPSLKIITGLDTLCAGLPFAIQKSLQRLHSRDFGGKVDIWISHKPPDRYPKFPYRGLTTVEKRPRFVVGRSMIESNKISGQWATQCNSLVDEVWVPSRFLIDVFAKGGVKVPIVHVPEGIDVAFYDPKITKPLPIISQSSRNFRFLSVFKWEHRKGVDILLRAYFEEFSIDEDVTLYLQTYLYMDFEPRDKERIMERARSYARLANPRKPIDRLPRIEILSDELPTMDMPRLYRSVDAFVLPTRGEGWGLPIMEAMAMGLPTIATKWSGQMDFMNETNSYLIDVERFKNGEEPIIDHRKKRVYPQFAEPSVTHLRKLMRRVFENRSEARERGRIAREHIVQNFSNEKVAQIVIENIQRLETQLQNRDIK